MQHEFGDDGTSPNALAGGEVKGQNSPAREGVPRREVWLLSALGDVSLTIPSEGHPDLDGETRTASAVPTPGTAYINRVESAKENQPGACGRRTNPQVSSFTDVTHPINGMIVKKRYFSPTHWMFSMTLTPHALDWLDEQVRIQGRIWQDLMTCKLLARSIKAGRVLRWTPGQYGTHLPTRRVADDLLNAYLRTFETIYRIIHIPTSRRAYDAFWENPGLVNPAHVVQLQLCLAIGACFYDEMFSLRPQALQWIREADHWLESTGKLRLTVFDIQTMCLLHLARQTSQFLREYHVWASSGALVRAAMSVGLHRDPARLPAMPTLEIEMRRRLWATIIELVLDSSMDAGGPPMFSLDDFDCSLPLNINDAELDVDGDSKVTPHDLTEYTDTSIQIALGKTFAVRLSIAKYANSIKAETSYPETLKFGSELMTGYRSLVKYLHSLNPPPTKFQRQYCEFVLSRYIFSLYLPYIPRAMRDPSQFYFSRVLCVDTAIRLTSFFLPLSSSRQEPLISAMHNILPFESHCSDYVRLVTCGSCAFRSINWQAVMAIAAELEATIRQAHDTSPWMSVVPFDRTKNASRMRGIELLAVLQEGAKWTKQRVQAGHHNAKDLVYINVVVASIEAAMSNAPSEQAMDAKGRETLAEAKKILAEMSGTGTDAWDISPNLAQEGLGVSGEFWSIGFSGMEWDTSFI